MVKILMATGSLEWDLAEKVDHRAGDVLTINFTITNPAAEARTYQIYMALFDPDTGSVITGTTGPIAVGGVDVFEVAGNSQLTLEAALKIDYSNANVQAALYDVTSGEMAVGLQAFLKQPEEVEEPVGEPVVESVMPEITGLAVGMMALGMVGMMMSGVTQGMEE